MSFDSHKGTRGARQPKGALLRWITGISARRVKKGHGMGGMSVLVLVTIGKKSGKVRETPVAWFPGPDGGWIIVASAAGATDNPAWYYNLAAHPDRVSIVLDARPIAVTPRQLHGAERAAAWQVVVSRVPRFESYLSKTDRELPVMLLTAEG
ncbi:nitroreductase/quinone reductase family protein [Microbacterium sp. B2969]|uniref:Nitroreductase/quinone reductase family protein n=1 Tax=Microbacterium alkaliflavum TaxID=3248839 RepID=A0ABW7QGT2_9MICO